jgi:RNA polymerase sigma-70 factor (ECF subfamily)
MLFRLTNDRDRAQDLFQETWLAAARHAHGLKEETHLIAWLCTIARNKFKNDLRASASFRRLSETLALEPTGGSSQPDDELERRRKTMLVANALACLSASSREVLVLAAVDGLKSGEIARILELREDAARKRLSRARTELAAIVGRRQQIGQDTKKASEGNQW